MIYFRVISVNRIFIKSFSKAPIKGMVTGVYGGMRGLRLGETVVVGERRRREGELMPSELYHQAGMRIKSTTKGMVTPRESSLEPFKLTNLIIFGLCNILTSIESNSHSGKRPVT